ncbi:MAG: hypothetical protein IKU09_06820 [Firmicutes bacterium]|nr:hypothetical protein [Bacillota bacterium]
MDYMEITKRKIKNDKAMLRQMESRLGKCPPGYLKCVHVHGRPQYYHILPGNAKPIYINRKHIGLVHELKYKRTLQESVRRLRQNILLEEKMLRGMMPWDYETVSRQLPKTYQVEKIPWGNVHLQNGPRFTQSENPFYREYLTQQTTFGLITRTRGEAMYAEQLYSAGFTLYYEKELLLRDENGKYHRRYPDFTIPLAGGLLYYLEHKGMVQNPKYRARDEETMRLYHLNGIYEPKNLLVTKDGPDETFPAEDIARIIQCVLVPLK